MQIGSGSRRFEDRLLFGVVRGRCFMGIPRETVARTGHDDRPHAVGGGAGRTAAAQGDGLPQVMQILLRAVGMQRVGRHLHSFQPSALLREACRIERRFETGGVRVADADGGIDGHAERVDEPLRKKKAECARASLDEQPFEAPLFQFGEDPRRRKVGDTDDFGRCFERRCGSVVGEDDPCTRACGEEV